jgi:hypothetical protein
MSHMSELAAVAEAEFLEVMEALKDAEEDRYFEIKDEPPEEMSRQEYEENKDCYLCHQKREG